MLAKATAPKIFQLFLGSKRLRIFNYFRFASTNNSVEKKSSSEFETVFTLPSIKYFAVFQRLKIYHLAGCAMTIPSCGILETLSAVPEYSFLTTAYLGITGAIVLSLFSLPFRNIIGFIYVSKDNEKIKISSVNFWGKRCDKIVPAKEWVPLMDMPRKHMDAIFFSPKLSDGTVYKLFLSFGEVVNKQKMADVIE